MSDEITPFRIEVPEATLDDLRRRLEHTRRPERETVEDWSQGVPLAYVQELCDYWGQVYDWRTPLPGYGFSDKPAEPGWGIGRIAAAWAILMGRLGYERYGAQGSDWGTSVSASIGQLDPDHVAGIHLTPPLAPPDPETFDDLTEDERAALASLERSAEWDSGYSQEHATRPRRSATR